MAHCDNDECPTPHLPAEYQTGLCFSGYGYYLKYHYGCCPGYYDGMQCWQEHPQPPVYVQGHWHAEPICAHPDCKTYLNAEEMERMRVHNKQMGITREQPNVV